MKNAQKTNLYAGIFSLVYGIVLFVLTATMGATKKGTDVGADFLPRIIAILIIALSLGFIAVTVSGIMSARKAGTANDEAPAEKKNYKGIIMTMALLIAYVALMNTIGFIVTTIVYLFLQMLILGHEPTKKQIILYAVISVVAPIIIYYVFVNGFQLLLPAGILA